MLLKTFRSWVVSCTGTSFDQCVQRWQDMDDVTTSVVLAGGRGVVWPIVVPKP